MDDTQKEPKPYRVTVESVKALAVQEFASAEEAQQCVEEAKKNPETWHIYVTQRTPQGSQVLQLSLYRMRDTGEWWRKHFG